MKVADTKKYVNNAANEVRKAFFLFGKEEKEKKSVACAKGWQTCVFFIARTSALPERMHDWNHQRCLSLTTIGLTAYQVPSSTYLYVITVEGTTVQYIYTKHPNHSWENVYDCGCTKNTLTALYTTDQQHVLIGSTNLPRNNDHRRRCTIVDDVPS